jgi:hypothetical protein
MGRLPVKASLVVVSFALVAAACSKSSTPPASTSSSGASEAPPAAIPTAKTISQPVVYGYYDGHVDAMLSTDVSSKTQAASSHINYSPALATQPANKFPALYTIVGRAAPNQPVVFGSQPGESDYSPLWDEVNVRWKPGVTPVLLGSDNEIKAAAAKGQLTISPTNIVLNCPIVKVG